MGKLNPISAGMHYRIDAGSYQCSVRCRAGGLARCNLRFLQHVDARDRPQQSPFVCAADAGSNSIWARRHRRDRVRHRGAVRMGPQCDRSALMNADSNRVSRGIDGRASGITREQVTSARLTSGSQRWKGVSVACRKPTRNCRSTRRRFLLPRRSQTALGPHEPVLVDDGRITHEYRAR